MFLKPTPPTSTGLALRSLAPRYDKAQHELYVKALTAALRNDGIRNIALTGAYGTGKSSVLQRLAELDEFKKRVLELSLSTVGVTEHRPDGKTEANPAAWTTVNLIQKEIVKQILYRDPPEKTRGSRFRRLSGFRWLREVGIAAGLAVLLLAIGWMAGLTAPLLTWLGNPTDLWPIAAGYGALLAVLTGIVYALRWLTHNRVFLEKLSAGPATVSLAPTSSSYFDQYMDEIIYYFEQSGRNIVIFEDIDRFEDIHIFETLRALNALLNGSEQIRRRRRSKKQSTDGPTGASTEDAHRAPELKFIYALRDSVFEKLGTDQAPTAPDGSIIATGTRRDAADDEVQRANRTKFFDLVIPMVPFITHRNARDLMLTTMRGTGVSRDLINVAARFVADMRLITNLRNEYDIYADRLLAPLTRMPGLEPDQMFALILYKSVHMADFEAIRLGSSDLDRLHDAWREIVNDSLSDAHERDRDATNRVESTDVDVARAKALGDRLELIAQAMTAHVPQATSVVLDGLQRQGDDLRQPAFWHRVAAQDVSIMITNPHSSLNITLSRGRLETLMGERLSAIEWRQIDKRTAQFDQRKARDDIAFLRHHGWSQLHARPEFTSKSASGEPENFAEATNRILTSRLARALVVAGYINEYFALYVSMYYGQHLRPRALNYSIHALDRGVADINANLDADDVEAIITDKGTDVFRDRAAYNVSVLDHLLTKRPSEAKMMVEQLATWDSPDRDFAEIYLKSGKEQVTLVRLLAPLIPGAITSFVMDAPREMLAQVVDAALDYSGALVEGDVINQVVIDNYRQFPSISEAAGPTGPARRKHQTMDAIAKLGIQLPATSPLTSIARGRAVALKTYQLNEENIADLTRQDSLALDAVLAGSPPVYNVALARAGEYLALVRSRDDAVTISDPHQFLPIIRDAIEAALDPHQLAHLIRASSSDCHVENLSDAPESVWSTLAAQHRMTPSASNLLKYLDHAGSIDDSAAKLLERVETIPATNQVPDADRARLAAAILSARDSIPSADHRVNLAASLQLPAPLDTSSLSPESGQLVGLLIRAKMLADHEATFASELMVDWPTREAALAQSSQAPDFISPLSLPPQNLTQFFHSGDIPQRLKESVLSRITAFIPSADKDGVCATTEFAISIAADLQITTIDQLRESGAPDRDIVALLVDSKSVTPADISTQLRMLAEPYPAIADRGYGRKVVPDDDIHVRLLEILRKAGIVSKHEPEKDGRAVYLRRPPNA